jgi:hypothetical protein
MGGLERALMGSWTSVWLAHEGTRGRSLGAWGRPGRTLQHAERAGFGVDELVDAYPALVALDRAFKHVADAEAP